MCLENPSDFHLKGTFGIPGGRYFGLFLERCIGEHNGCRKKHEIDDLISKTGVKLFYNT